MLRTCKQLTSGTGGGEGALGLLKQYLWKFLFELIARRGAALMRGPREAEDLVDARIVGGKSGCAERCGIDEIGVGVAVVKGR